MTSIVDQQSQPHKDAIGVRIGMWLFLFTEVLLFGGLILLYAVYRAKFPQDFHFCAGQLDTGLGTLNTAILLTSSLTIVLAVTSLEKKNKKLTTLFLLSTMFFGIIFLINKYIEWSTKFEHQLYPNSEVLQTHPAGENIFYSLYYLMTGLHALHIIIGLIILFVMLILILRKSKEDNQEELERLSIRVENSGLYWHLVVIIWIFLFPLFYLIT